nr:MAG TPA: hypothetical protein [Caudoviricetes sp.]
MQFLSFFIFLDHSLTLISLYLNNEILSITFFIFFKIIFILNKIVIQSH